MRDAATREVPQYLFAVSCAWLLPEASLLTVPPILSGRLVLSFSNLFQKLGGETDPEQAHLEGRTENRTPLVPVPGRRGTGEECHLQVRRP